MNLLLDKPVSARVKRPSRGRQLIQQALKSEDSYATTLVTLLIDTYGTEAFQWHPETIRLELEQDFGVDIDKNPLDKLMAGIAVVTTNYFTREVRRFIELCTVLAGDDFDPTVFEPADSAEMAWGVTEAMILGTPEEAFDAEIRAYIAHVLKEEGYVKPPKILRFASREFKEIMSFDFETDPEMFQAVYESQEAKSAEIDALVMDNLRELMDQLASLPLRNGDTSRITEKMRRAMK